LSHSASLQAGENNAPLKSGIKHLGGLLDILNGNGGNDYLEGGAGIDTINGGAGIDTAGYANASNAITVLMTVDGLGTAIGGDGLADTLTGIENVVGSNFNDNMTGDNGNNVLAGLNGNDTLNGGGGNDTLIGGAGNDTLNGGAGDDILDTRLVNEFGAPLPDGNDVLDGGAGNDRFLLASGFDTIQGGDGIDSVQFDGDAVSVALPNGGVPAPILDRESGLQVGTLVGVENLIGGSNEGLGDTLTGNNSNNRLTGRIGADLLTGNGGADTFVYLDYQDSSAQNGIDTITDFTIDVDKIDLSAISQNPEFGPLHFVPGSIGGSPGDVAYDEVSGIVNVWIHFGSESPDMEIRLTGAPSLDAADFIL
jgi:Ca2+-binding RTX toxin-like protein